MDPQLQTMMMLMMKTMVSTGRTIALAIINGHEDERIEEKRKKERE